jgi:hypothetical protein
MKTYYATFIWVALFSLLCFSAYAQSDLEEKIERVFLYESDRDERFNRKAKIDQIGSGGEVRTILLGMLMRYKGAEPESKEYVLLLGATNMLGEMAEAQAVAPLTRMVFDKKVHENVRAYAVRALGQIDPEGNKNALLKALANKDDYFAVRVYAAESLGKTKDVEVLKALEKYSGEETDSHVKQKFEKAAQEVRGKLRRP